MQARIEAALKAAGLVVYPAATKIGKVNAPYLVVHDMGTMPKEGSMGMLGKHLYEIVLLTPVAQQAQLSTMAKQARDALRAIQGLRDTGDSQPTSGLTPEFDGASMSLIYACQVRLA